MKRSWLMMMCIFLTCLLSAGCVGTKMTDQEKSKNNRLVIYCPHPISLIQPLVSEFEQRSGVKVEIISAGTGELLKRVQDEQDNPLADIFWGGSLHTLRVQAELFDTYISIHEPAVQEGFKNREGKFTRFSEVPSVLMVNTRLLGNISVAGYEDLLQPELKGRIAAADPERSSSGYEHLINALYAMGKGEPEAGWDYVEAFCRNLDGKLLSGSSAVYKSVADGDYAVGLTFEEGAVIYAASGAPVKVVYMKEGVIAEPDGIGIVKNARHRDNARKFVDFVMSREAQTMLAHKLHRRSVRTDVEAPQGLIEKDKINIIHDDGEVVAINKEAWLKKFRGIFVSVQ